jgi:Uncharacterized protein conserved in bacteria (DUF2314)
MASREVDFRIADGETRHHEAPDGFEIPSREARESLQLGDFAKLVFEIVDPTEEMPGAERMWVAVIERQDGGFLGVLENIPAVITTIRLGDRISFRPEHVIEVYDWDTAEDPDPGSGVAFHTKGLICIDVLDDSRPVLLVTRPERDWWFLCGHVHPEDPDEYRFVEIRPLLERDPTIHEVLDLEPGQEAERLSVGRPWVRSQTPPET